MGEFGVEHLTPTGIQTVFSTFGRTFHGIRGFSPNGITIAPDGTTYIDTYWGNGYTNKSAIAMIRANGTSSLLWAGPANSGG